jgi:hypothetical protein
VPSSTKMTLQPVSKIRPNQTPSYLATVRTSGPFRLPAIQGMAFAETPRLIRTTVPPGVHHRTICGHRAVEHVGKEERYLVSSVEHGHVPRTVDERAKERFHGIAGIIESDQASTCAVAEVPSEVGKLPTITHPERRPASAVVKSTPPGRRPRSVLA